MTSLNRAEAANFGRDEHMGHDARYDRADEFMEVVLGHWNTWEDDALILDKANSRFADPAKVHRLDHGPVLPVARPVQRAAVAAGPSDHAAASARAPPRRQVALGQDRGGIPRWLADDRLLLRRAFADQAARPR